jgi:hypothetical protein
MLSGNDIISKNLKTQLTQRTEKFKLFLVIIYDTTDIFGAGLAQAV